MAIHQNLVKDKQCIEGIKDELTVNIGMNLAYPDYSCSLFYLCRFVFSDGHKRTALLTLKLLEIDLDYIGDWIMIDYIILELATKSISKEAFRDKIISTILI